MISRRLRVALGLAASLHYGPADAGRRSVPLVVGGDTKVETCMSLGEIVDLDPQGDGFLSVRSGPGGRGYTETDRLHNRDRVWVCGYGHLPWYPVIYDRSGRRDCLVGTVRAERGIYRGPCRSGWIHSRYVRIIAG